MKHLKNILVVSAIFMMAVWCLYPSQARAWGRGHIYVIGTGPSGPQMATLQALETIKRMDIILAPEGTQLKLFAAYIKDKPVLFDPWDGLFDYKGKSMFKLTAQEMSAFNKKRFRIREKRVAQIQDHLARGNDVGLLDSGNPCLFGPSHWYIEQFDPKDVVIIPGMGCDAAAMAALGKSTIPAHDTRFVLQTAPFFLTDWGTQKSRILKDLAKYSTTMVFYMALYEPDKLFSTLRAELPPDMPCAVVFWAGYPDRQRIVHGTVADMGERLSRDDERFMGLLFVGRFLEGKPYEKAILRGQAKTRHQ